jgi:putative ABC transport system permease protein
MKGLQLKLVRDMATSKVTLLAVTAVILLGVALFNAGSLGYYNLRHSYDYSYETLAFADFTVKVVKAPAEAIGSLKSIPGVKAVSGRLNTDIPLTIPGNEAKTISARVITMPATSRPSVDDVKVEEGSYFPQNEDNALMVEKSLAKYYRMKPGDTVSLAMGAQSIEFQVSGIVTSPEYLWPAKSRQEAFVSPETFGVVFITQETMARLTGDSSLNEFCVIVDKGADRDLVISKAESILEPYGIMGVVPVEAQASNAILKVDLQLMGSMAQVFSLLFLVVAALVTYVILARIVSRQSSQIGLMRASGYSRRQVLLHYLSFGLIIGVAGSAAGSLAGYFLADVVARVYVRALGLPFTSAGIPYMLMVEGFFVGMIPCVIAGIIPAYAASRLKPAEAMRAPAPARGMNLLLERAFRLCDLSHLWTIPLRNILRNGLRSIYTVLGVAFGISLILVSVAFIDSMNSFMSLQFGQIQKYDAQVAFAQPQPETIASQVLNEGLYNRVEPVLQIPVSLEYKGKTYSTMAIGLTSEAELYGLYSTNGERTTASDRGILLSGALRKTLGVDVGDVINLRSASGSRQIQVAGFVKQPMGALSYVTLHEAQALLGEQQVINGLMLDINPQYQSTLRQVSSRIPNAASVEVTSETKAMVGDRMSFNSKLVWIMFVFGVALASTIVFAAIYAGLQERRREIATMRTLGESKRRIAQMITMENLTLGLLGIILGLPLSYMLAAYSISLLQTDMLSYGLVILPQTYLIAVVVVILIMIISQMPAIRQLNRLNLASVINEHIA